MPARTKRVRLNPGPFVVLGLVVNLVAGALYSPLTAVRKVRVEGAPEADRPRLQTLLQKLRGVPCAQVNARELESEALQNSELISASLSRSPIGSAVLTVHPRTAVAQLDKYQGTGLTEDGVFYSSSTSLEGLPKVILPPDYRFVNLTLGNGWRVTDVAHLATLVQTLKTESPVEIDLDKGGRVCLNIDTGRVDLGACEGLDRKVARLESILRERPDLFKTVQKLILVNIDNPAYVPRPEKTKR